MKYVKTYSVSLYKAVMVGFPYVQTPENCIAAVQKDSRALQYVKEQTREICLAAVQKDGYALQYVKEQTPEICLAAVQQNGTILNYVKEQTPEICMAAIQQNYLAYKYVKEKTPDIRNYLMNHTDFRLREVKNGNIIYHPRKSDNMAMLDDEYV